MSFFSFRRSKPSPSPKGSAPLLDETEALALALAAKDKDDWGTALVALGRLKSKKDAGADCHLLRGWALACGGRLAEADGALTKGLQLKPEAADAKAQLTQVKARRKARDAANGQTRPWSKVKLGAAPFGLHPADALALTQVMMAVRPKEVLELGSCGGGVAEWLATARLEKSIPQIGSPPPNPQLRVCPLLRATCENLRAFGRVSSLASLSILACCSLALRGAMT